ncbi:MAG: NAD(P)-dependent oxidoreductase [Proteobacteria bacterium]|jgi:3-hydroxyisobutyrate dehydrogenase-like beta-hydroxyacid dehydrogenase|nr:NAD(P)-dependent oxidoreductase [Pseudomonadota bacterium]
MDTRISFIGLGIMGLPMAGHLLAAGYPLTVYNRTVSKTESLVKQGAKLAATPAEAAQDADVVISMVSDTPDVEQVLLGESGVMSTIQPNALVIDMSTISPAASQLIYEQFAAKQVDFLDAPVSGGDVGAINATLTIMVGGDEAAFQRALPMFECLGKTATLIGASGAGQICKACNQILVASNLMGVCEALGLAAANNIELEPLVNALGGGAAQSWQLDNLGPAILNNQLDPGFMIELLAKDLRIVKEALDTAGTVSDSTAKAKHYFDGLMDEGDGRLGTQALVKAYEQQGKVRIRGSS